MTKPGEHLWEFNHVCDTLCDAHLALFDAETDTRILIDRMANAAWARLDEMVEAGNKRQAQRQLDFEHPWYARLRAHLEAHQRLSIQSGYRTHEEQKRLYDRWVRSGRAPAYAIPRDDYHSHHELGRAIDLDFSRKRWPDEPWHYSYTTPVKGRWPLREHLRAWWDRAVYRWNWGWE